MPISQCVFNASGVGNVVLLVMAYYHGVCACDVYVFLSTVAEHDAEEHIHKVPTTAAERGHASLTTAQLLQLTHMAIKIAVYYQHPQVMRPK